MRRGSASLGQRPVLIGLVGFSGSGKSTVAQLLRESGFAIFDNREVMLSQIEKEAGLSLRQRLEVYGRGESLFHFLHPFLAKEVERTGLLVVDSFKVPADPEVIRRYLPVTRLELLAVVCPRSVRAGRVMDRGRRYNTKDVELLEAGLDRLMAEARHVVWTDCQLSALKERVSLVGQELRNVAALSANTR